MNIIDKIHLKIIQARINRIKRKNPNLSLDEPIEVDYENLEEHEQYAIDELFKDDDTEDIEL